MSKEINRENVTNAMKLLLDNKGCNSDEIRQKLKDCGYNWSREDYSAYRKANSNELSPGVNKGLVSGDMHTALSFALYAQGGKQRWEYIQDWMSEPISESSYCLKNWIKASEKIMENSRQLEDIDGPNI